MAMTLGHVMVVIATTLLLPAVTLAGVASAKSLFTCQYTGNNTNVESIENCPYCFASWKESGDPKIVQTSISRGCFNYDGPRDAAEECMSSQCFHLLLEEDKNISQRFCCCAGNECNREFSAIKEEEYYKILDSQSKGFRSPTSFYADPNFLIYLGLALVFLLLFSVFVMLLTRYRQAKRSDRGNGGMNLEKGMAAASSVKLEEDAVLIEINENVVTRFGSGDFGSTLYHATAVPIDGSKPSSRISIKVFTRLQKQGFINEKDVYEAIENSVSKDRFIRYLGSKDDIHFGDHSIILERNRQLGFLDNFLKAHTVSWNILCKMLTSIGNCLSLMHSGFNSPSTSFVHRNLNSRNVLVRSDFSCAICNFEHVASFADEMKQREKRQVGTPRYMSPEILEDDGSTLGSAISLKQADIYSLGLLFWEIARRCGDLYQGVPIPPFQLAFQNELGLSVTDPTIDQMKILVSKRKSRPLFPEVWKNSNLAIQQIRETIEDCWDQDGEARLTSFCVVERCKQLEPLWSKWYAHRRYQHEVEKRPNNLKESSWNQKTPIYLESNDLSSCSPLAQNLNKNDNLLSLQCPPLQIQPHQGRNPCAERNNLMPGSSVDSSLISKSFKDETRRVPNTQNETQGSAEELPLRIPRARAQRLTRPIEYFQNDFRESPSGNSEDKDGKKSQSKLYSKFHVFTKKSSKDADVSKSTSSASVVSRPLPKFNNVESERLLYPFNDQSM